MTLSWRRATADCLSVAEYATFYVSYVFDLSTTFMFQVPGGSTDCALPITWATENGKTVDVFIVLTNNPLWTFTASPVESLKKHREVCLKRPFVKTIVLENILTQTASQQHCYKNLLNFLFVVFVH